MLPIAFRRAFRGPIRETGPGIPLAWRFYSRGKQMPRQMIRLWFSSRTRKFYAERLTRNRALDAWDSVKEPISDETISLLRSLLSATEIARCTRASLAYRPHPDEIPF